MNYSGDGLGIDFGIDASLPDLSKFSHFVFEDIEAESQIEGKSRLRPIYFHVLSFYTDVIHCPCRDSST